LRFTRGSCSLAETRAWARDAWPPRGRRALRQRRGRRRDSDASRPLSIVVGPDTLVESARRTVASPSHRVRRSWLSVGHSQGHRRGASGGTRFGVRRRGGASAEQRADSGAGPVHPHYDPRASARKSNHPARPLTGPAHGGSPAHRGRGTVVAHAGTTSVALRARSCRCWEGWTRDSENRWRCHRPSSTRSSTSSATDCSTPPRNPTGSGGSSRSGCRASGRRSGSRSPNDCHPRTRTRRPHQEMPV
jgi:hypothetical protein